MTLVLMKGSSKDNAGGNTQEDLFVKPLLIYLRPASRPFSHLGAGWRYQSLLLQSQDRVDLRRAPSSSVDRVILSVKASILVPDIFLISFSYIRPRLNTRLKFQCHVIRREVKPWRELASINIFEAETLGKGLNLLDRYITSLETCLGAMVLLLGGVGVESRLLLRVLRARGGRNSLMLSSSPRTDTSLLLK